MNAATLRDAVAGEIVGSLSIPPITRHTLALYCGASGDHNPIHVDIDFARKAGMPDVFAHGMLVMAYLGRLLMRLAPPSALQRFAARFVAITHVGDSLTCTARLRTLSVVAERALAILDLAVEDQNGEVKLRGEAEIDI